MENLQKIYTWEGLLSLIILFVLLYGLLNLVVYVLERFSKKNRKNKHVQVVLKKGLLVFKPIAIILVLLNFISINYITHSLLIVVIGVFGYHHIKNYINGVFIRINPLVILGASISIGKSNGRVKTLLPLGMVISTDQGEQFLNYITIENKGFSINSSENNELRQTIYLHTEHPKDTILDLLFINPIIKYSEPPVLKKSNQANVYKLQYTIEDGATNTDLVEFLKNENILTTLTNTSLS